MADNKWNDKLRKQMSEYTQAPPEGLWEAVESRLGERRAAAFPWWWALAGAAAAVLAVLLLFKPEQEPIRPNDPVVAVVQDPVNPPADDPDAASVDPAGEPGTQTDAPAGNFGVLRRTAPSGINATAENEVPAGDAVPGGNDDPSTVIPEAREEKEGKDVKEEEKPEQKTHSVQIKQYPAERPLLADASGRKLRLSLMAGGVPGGATTSSINEYGMSATMKMSPGRPGVHSAASLLSRNRSTVTNADYTMLYRFGVMANLPLSNHWSLESGLQVSRLAGDVVSTSGNMSTNTHSDLYYLGVPLLAVFTPWSGRNLSVYMSAGPMAEYGVRLSGNIREIIGDKTTLTDIETSVPGDWIWSLGANAGVQLQVGRLGALFVQPGVSWHLPSEESPESYYTAHPFAFNLAAGFRLLF